MNDNESTEPRGRIELVSAPPEGAVSLKGPEAGTIARADFGGQEIQALGETASTAMAAAAKAEIEAAYIMALQRPRDLSTVYERIMKDCKRPSFAAVARYNLKRGGTAISGPSIRFAEAALRAMGNVRIQESLVYDDPDRQIIRVVATDLETNSTFAGTCVVNKSVERKFPEQGRRIISSRTNSSNQTTYLVEATEDDLRMKRAAEVSRVVRNLGLRLIPGDIVDDAMNAAKATALDRAAKDPDGERKAIILGFSTIGVTPEQLAEYVGHPLQNVVPAELVDLRGLWKAIQDGQTTWKAAMAERAGDVADKTPPAPASRGTAAAKDALKQKAAEKAAVGKADENAQPPEGV